MNKIRSTIIKAFGLKGSWSWAKKQMLKGSIVRSKHFSGTLKYKIESPENTLLQCSFRKTKPYGWETSNHFLSYEDYIDWEVITQ